MIRRRKNRLAALEREAVELRGLIQQTNAALAKVSERAEREFELIGAALTRKADK